MNLYIKQSFLFFVSFISISSLAQEINIDDSLFEDITNEQIESVREIIDDKKNVKSEVRSIREDKTLKKNNPEISVITATNKFGYNFISTSPTSIVATGDVPLPNDYKIALGDVLGVVLSGSNQDMFDMQVQLDGSIFFPGIGSISAVGDTFQELKQKLKNLVNQTYIGVEIDLSLKELSAKKITIVGTVNNPGTYLVNPFTTISNALAYSGGVTPIGTLRNIKLIRINGEVHSFDLYELLIDGIRTNDLTIESGDVIIVGAANKFVEIKGAVKRSGVYEILPNENLSDILKFSLGFSGGANIDKIVISELDLISNKINKKVVQNTSNLPLKNIIDIEIFKVLNKKNAGVLVEGAITEPGFYKLEDYPSLEKLINDLNFVDVYPWLAVLEQFDQENLIKSSILFSLNDEATYKSIKLLPNSRIYFANLTSRSFIADNLSRSKIRDYALTINHKQGTFILPIFGKYSLQSFVDLLGLDMSDVDSQATYLSPLENIVIKDDYKNMNYSAKKYNTVSFRSPINNLIQVTIEGEVDYPGTYTLQSNSTLEDLYSLVGNFKKEAYLNGIIFTRDSIRERQLKAITKSKQDLNEAILVSAQKGAMIGDISIIRALSETIEPENLGRIAGDFSPKSLSAVNTLLIEGDTVIVPKNPNAINVLGEVLNPIAFEYENRISVRQAIDNAGGYKEYANKNGVYIIKANGLIERVNRNVFVKNTRLEPGDSVIVPRKIITNNPGIDALLPLTQILSDLSFSAAALESLSN